VAPTPPHRLLKRHLELGGDGGPATIRMLVIHPQPAQSIRQAASGIFAGMDEIERSAIRDEGYDPDDPRVIAALDRVRAALASGLVVCPANN